MKTLLFMSVLSFMATSEALACMPPRNAIDYQDPEITAVVSKSDAFQKLREIGGTDIESIRTIKGNYVISASNGCFVEMDVKYSTPDGVGMCPRIVAVELASSGCKRN